MDSGFFEEITQFVRFTPSDGQTLRAFRTHARPHFHAIIERFYERIEEHVRAANVLRNEAQTQRLKGTLRHWLDELLAGPWDDEYCDKRARIGKMHVKVGLAQRYMSTGMAVIRSELLAIANDAYADDVAARDATVGAINRVLDLDLTIMLETYRSDSLALVRRVEQREHELLERKLRISEARYESVIEQAEVLIVAVSREGRLVMFNRKAERLTEHSRTEMAGTPIFEVICSEDDQDRVSEAVQLAFSGVTPAPFDARIVSRRGVEHWIRWHVTMLAGADDPVVCAIGVDVTDERSLHRRTQQAEKLATLGALAAGLAHEIRNPLNSAQLQLMLVERRVKKLQEDASTPVLKSATIVREELHRLAGLVEDFLAFARPRRLRVTSGDLCTTVATVVGLVKPEAEERRVELALDCKHVTVALFDEERMKQVILNLVRNAVQAAGVDGCVDVVVRRDASRALVDVVDSGDGVPDDIDIFEPFSTSKTSGTGLGLPIVKRIIDDHGGDISYSRDNDLTRFRVELPLEGPQEHDKSAEPQ